MNKTVRISIGVLLVAIGVVFFILPGSILFLIAGLTVLSIDIPVARGWLKKCQAMASKSAKSIDRWFLKRKA